MNMNEFSIEKSSEFCSTLISILHNISTSRLNKYNLVLLKKTYQRSFSEILNAIGLLGAKLIFLFLWEMPFVLKSWELI